MYLDQSFIYMVHAVKWLSEHGYLFPNMASPPVQYCRKHSKDSTRILGQYCSKLIREMITKFSA